MLTEHQIPLRTVLKDGRLPVRAALELTAEVVEILSEVGAIAPAGVHHVSVDLFDVYSDGQLCLSDPEQVRPVTVDGIGLLLAGLLLGVELEPMPPGAEAHRTYVTSVLSAVKVRYADRLHPVLWRDLEVLLKGTLDASPTLRTPPLQVLRSCLRLASMASGESLPAHTASCFRSRSRRTRPGTFFRMALIAGLAMLNVALLTNIDVLVP